MNYEENETLRLIGKQSFGVVPNDAKSQIYDVADAYYKNKEIGFSGMLRFGTDIFILGLMYGKQGEKDAIS